MGSPSKSSNTLRRSGALPCCPSAGSWREPSQTAEQDHDSTDGRPRAIIGLSGLLHLVEAVERVRAAQRSRSAEGAEPCRVQPSLVFPPAPSGRREQSV